MIDKFLEVCQLELNRSQKKGYMDVCSVWTVFCCDASCLLSERFSRSARIDIYKFLFELGLDFEREF